MARTLKKHAKPQDQEIDVRVTKLPEGEQAVTWNLEQSIEEFKNGISTGLASFYLGSGALGEDINKLKDNSKKNHRSILGGDTNSIFYLLTNIKTVLSASKLANTMQLLSSATSKYLANVDNIYSYDEANYMNLLGITDLLNDILTSINGSKSDESKESAQKIQLLIKGLDDKTIDKLIELSERDIDPTSRNSRALNNFLLAIKHFAEIDKKTIEGIDNLNSIILPINNVLKRIEKLNETIGDGNTLVETVGKIQRLFAAIKEIKTMALEKDDTDIIMHSVKGVNDILKEMAAANQELKDTQMKDLETYVINLIDIFGDGTWLDVLFTALNDMHPVDPEQTSMITDGVVGINTILFYLKNLGIEADNIIPSNLSFLDFIFYSGENPSNLKNIFHGLNGVADMTNKDKYQRIVENIGHIKNILDGLSQIKVDKNLPDTLNVLTAIFAYTKEGNKTVKSKAVQALSEIFKGLNAIDVADQNKVKKIITSLEGISSIIETLSNIDSKATDVKNMRINILDYLDVLEEVYEDIKTKYDQIIQLADMADAVKVANKKIDESLDSCNEVAVKTNQRNEEIKKASLSMSGLAGFMIAAAVVMSIGALFMMLGGGKFVKNALLFGVTLMAFEAMVIAPLLLFSTQESTAFPALENLNSFVITCTATMLVGALFMTLGGGRFMKAALGFAITLGLFEALVIAPMMIFKTIAKDALSSLENLSVFVITCTIVLSIGALFMMLGGGKFVKNALAFGVTLMAFEAIIVAPFLLFGKYSKELNKDVIQFSGFVIICTTIMLIGALFMTLGGGKFVKNAFLFGVTLMMFEALVVAPFLLLNMLKDNAINGMKLFSGIVIACTTILLIGALFMTLGGGKFVVNALKFTGLLMLFEIGVILPLLILNKMKNQIFKGLVDFTAMIIVCTTALLVGALFMTLGGGKMPIAAIEFTALLAMFELAIVAPILLFKEVSQEALKSATQLGIFVALCTASLIGGAAYINTYGSSSAWEFALLLAGFVGIMETIAVGLSRWLNGKAMANMKELGIFIGISSAALLIGAMFIATYGAKSVVEYAIVLGLFVGMMEGTVLILNKFMGDPKTIASMSAFGIFVGISSLALIAGALYIEKYGVGSAINYAIVLTIFIGLMTGVMALLGLAATYITPGIAVAQGLAIAIGTLSLSILLTNLIFENDPNGKHTLKNIGTLTAVLTGILGVFAFLGIPPVMVLITLGSVAATAIGVAIMVLSTSLGILDYFIDNKDNKIRKDIELLNDILSFDSLGKTFLMLSALGLVAPLGLIGAVAIGVSMMALSASLSIVDILMNEHGKTLPGNIDDLINIVGHIGILSIELIGVGALAILGNIAMIPIGLLSISLSTSMFLIASSVEKMAAVGDISSQTETIVNNLKSFINIIDEVIDFKDIFIKIPRLFLKLDAINSIIYPMGQTMISVATAIQDLANLKVASGWDKDGKAIRWRQLNEKDFNIAKDNIGKLLITMADAFHKSWYGGTIDGKQYEGLAKMGGDDEDSPIWQVTNFGIKVGQVISNVAEGVGNMAKMQIPIAWDSKGKAISYRQLKDKDFINAGKNVREILISMASTIMAIYSFGNNPQLFGTNKNIFDMVGGGLFSESEPSPFINTLEATLKIGQVISNIGEAVGNMAKMQIPTAWDKNGKAISFRQIKKRDFVEAGENIDTILTNVFKTLGNLYANGNKPEYGSNNGQNIFDEVSGGLLKSNDPSPLAKVIEASLQVSNMIANVATGIKDIATLQIPTQWDDKGHPIWYTKITSSDFGDAASSIETILTNVISAVANLNIDPDSVSEKIKSILPISEMIGNMAEGIVKLASGQVAKNWNKDGKAIEYTKIEKEDYIAAGEAISQIIKAQAESICDVVAQNPTYFGEDSDWFKQIVESVSTTGSLVSNIADSIIKVGQGLVADNWDKNGKPIHFSKINYTDAIADLESVLGNIIPATAMTIIRVYEGGTGVGGIKFKGLKDILGDNPDDDTPFNVAVRSINQITQIASNIVDTAIKLGSAQMPDWNAPWKDGKPTKYTQIKPNEIIANIQELFQGKDGKNGIITILANVISDIYDEYFATNKKFDPKNDNGIIATVSGGITQILQIISSSSDAIIKIASSKIPISWDKDGNVKEYVRLNDEEVNRSKEIITKIINGLLNIFDDETIKTYQTEKTKQNLINLSNNITDIVGTIGVTIATTLDQIKKINEYKDEITKFGSLDFTKMIKNLNDSISTLNNISSFTYDSSKETIFDYLSEELNNYTYNGIIPFDKNAYDQSNLLSKSITNINSIIASAKNTGNFAKTNEQLSKYVTTINSIKINNVDSLSKLVHELNVLNNTSRLDELAKAISEKLSVVLQNLVEKLDESKKTIDKAEEIQTKRHKLIDDSIKKVKEIMENPISVLVSSDTTESEDDGSGKGQSSESSETKSPIGSSVGSQGGGTPLENKEKQTFPERPKGVEIPKLFDTNTKGGGGS